MSQDEVVARIRSLASERGGRVSMRVFFEETGLNSNWLAKQLWYEGWNPLIRSLGLEASAFNTTAKRAREIAHAVAALAVRLKKWPAVADFQKERVRDASFPGLHRIRPLRRSGELARLIVELAKEDATLASAGELASAKLPGDGIQLIEQADRSADRVRGFVYLLRSGRRFKIGKSTDPSRRFREIKLELPDETHQVHSIATDDPAGIEAYWHRRFLEKRVRNTEFFELDVHDVKAFRRRAYQ